MRDVFGEAFGEEHEPVILGDSGHADMGRGIGMLGMGSSGEIGVNAVVDVSVYKRDKRMVCHKLCVRV